MAYLQHLGARVAGKVRTGDEGSTAGELHVDQTGPTDIIANFTCEGFAVSRHAGGCQRGRDQERAKDQTHVQRYSPAWKNVFPVRTEVILSTIPEKDLRASLCMNCWRKYSMPGITYPRSSRPLAHPAELNDAGKWICESQSSISSNGKFSRCFDLKGVAQLESGIRKLRKIAMKNALGLIYSTAFGKGKI